MLLYIHKGEGALSKISPKCPSSVLLTDWSLLRKKKNPPVFDGGLLSAEAASFNLKLV